MRSDDITAALGDVGQKWTRQIKSEEKRPSSRFRRGSMWTMQRTSLKEICFEEMEDAWEKASGGGRLPTHWRQIFYVMRPLVEEHPESDKPLTDVYFKKVMEEYLDEYSPSWDVLRGARGVFKEPHSAKDDNGLALSTMGVRSYLGDAGPQDAKINLVPARFPTKGADNRISAVLICEKEGFDELLEAEHIPERFDLALMSTKGISAFAARDLVGGLGVPSFTLHDLDKNGFVMTGGFRLATDLGIRLEDAEQWGLVAEPQIHKNPEKTYENLIANGATDEEAEFISAGQRVELNMFSSPDFIEYVVGKLEEHNVAKIVPDDETLVDAWKRGHLAARVNRLIESTWEVDKPATADLTPDIPTMPDDLADQIRDAFEDDDTQSWDEVLWSLMADKDYEPH